MQNITNYKTTESKMSFKNICLAQFLSEEIQFGEVRKLGIFCTLILTIRFSTLWVCVPVKTPINHKAILFNHPSTLQRKRAIKL